MDLKSNPDFVDTDWYKKLQSEIDLWPLMSSTAIPIVTCLVYFLFVFKIGPWIMSKRQPMKLKNLIIAYNIIQVMLSSWFLYLGLQVSIPGRKSSCLSDKERRQNIIKASYAFWWYMIGKFSELLDTVFFVLRKNNYQITWLHLFHHSNMVFFTWLILKFFIGEQVIVCVTLNSFIHIVMYSYYLVAGLGPKYKKYLWWKKHMTTMQIIQFLMMISYWTYLSFGDCVYRKSLTYFMIGNTILILIMFLNFFIKNYLTKPSQIPLNNEKTNNFITTNNTGAVSNNGLRQRQ